MPRIPTDTIRQFAVRVLEASGATPAAARLVSDHLVEASLVGHDSHGVARLKQYVDDIKAGSVDLLAKPRIVRQSPTTAVVDAGHCWGPVAGYFAVDVALEKVKAQSLAAVTVRRSHHIGRIGTYAASLADHGYIGIVHCSVQSVARVAPWGGTERRLATNPIAIAVPADDGSIVVDLATSAVAEGKVRLARAAGKPVPIGWVLDNNGQFSTDPSVSYEQGAIAPLGGDQGHKGYCLAVGVDLLGGVLAGIGVGKMESIYGNSFLLQAIDPEAFCDRDELRRRTNEYVQYVKATRRRDGVDEILMPGQIESQRRAANLRDGLDVASNVYDQLRGLGDSLGVALADH